MTQDQATLRRKFLTTAMDVKRAGGVQDREVVAAMLGAAHSFALRRDPTERMVEALFRDPHDAEAA